MAVDQGNFGFNQVMQDFYNYQPGEDDDEGRAIKRNFQANMVQSGFDQELAEGMAYTQSGIAQQNMTHAADLEQRNTAANMQQEFNYGMQSMAGQFEFQDKFADNQSERDIGMLTATGEQQRLLENSKGLQERYTIEAQGEQNKQMADIQGSYGNQQANIAADASKYGSKEAADASKFGSQQSADASKYGSKQAADASKFGAEKSADATKFSASQQADASKYGAKISADASITNTKTQAASTDKATAAQERASNFQASTSADASKYQSDKSSQASMYGADKTKEASNYAADANIRNTTETGKQQRETMGYQNELEGQKENRQAARSRSMARSF
jgi:flotillin